MAPIPKNERREFYEQAVRNFDAATAAHNAVLAQHPELVARVEQAKYNFSIVEARGEGEYDAANDEWWDAQNALDEVTMDTLNMVKGTQQLVYEAYDDYIA